MQTERVTYLTNVQQKAALEAFAKARGESVGNVLREAASRYMAQPTDDEEAELVALTKQVNEAIPRINATLERMSATLRKSHEEMEEFFRDKGIS